MPQRNTSVGIDGTKFLINGEPTYPGRTYRGWPIEGLLLNSRMANGIFDDDNVLTRGLWAYPDTGKWDAERNIAELIAALSTYRAHGMIGLPVNLQGASPLGYYRTDAVDKLTSLIRKDRPGATVAQVWDGLPMGIETQPWDSGAFTPDGALKPAYLQRVARLIDAADRRGMVVILGYFYFGQDERLTDEAAVKNAVLNATQWVLERGFTNVIIEINNECDVPKYEHEILTPPRVHELIGLAKSVNVDGRSLLVSTSFTRRMLPTEASLATSDFVLLHGNGITDPTEIAKRVRDTRALSSYSPMPILFNEDDHFHFDQPENNFTAALSEYAGWGYFDPGDGAGGSPAYGDYVDGYQNPPVNWGINTPRKRSFFDLLSEVTGDSPDTPTGAAQP